MKMIVRLMGIMGLVFCSMQVHIKNPVLQNTAQVQSDGSIVFDFSDSLNYSPEELQFQLRFLINDQEAGKKLGYGKASAVISAYQTFALPNNGTFYIKGTFENPEIHYVGGPATAKITVCMKAKDAVKQVSAEVCKIYTFMTDPSLENKPKHSVGGIVAGLNGTLVLQNNGGNNLTLNANGSFTFTTKIIEGGSYDVTVLSAPFLQTCTATNGSGTIATSNITNVTVTCVNKSWHHPELSDRIGPDDHHAFTSDIAMDDKGNAVLAWVQTDSAFHWQVFKAEYQNGNWTYPADPLDDNISPNGTDANISVISVAMNISGDAIIAWAQDDGVNDLKIYMSERRNGVWMNPTDLNDHISPGTTFANDMHVAMDDNGNAIIVWLQNDGGGFAQAFKSEYRNGVWTHPANLADNISPNGTSVANVAVAMDNNDNAIITWAQSDGTVAQVYKSEYRNGVWTHPANLADNGSVNNFTSYNTSVAMDDSGNAIISFLQDDGTNIHVAKFEYRNGNWTFPADENDNINPDGTDAWFSQVAMDDNGNAIITWIQSDGANNQIYKSEYRNGVWTNPANLADNFSLNGTDVSAPNVRMDNNGNAIISYIQQHNTNFSMNVYKAEYRNGAWTFPANFDDRCSPDSTDASSLSMAMSNNGDAIISMTLNDPTGYFGVFLSQYR